MSECVIGMKSRFLAEKSRRAAAMEKIESVVVSVDPSVTARGCTLGLKVSCEDTERVIAALERRKISYGTVIGRGR